MKFTLYICLILAFTSCLGELTPQQLTDYTDLAASSVVDFLDGVRDGLFPSNQSGQVPLYNCEKSITPLCKDLVEVGYAIFDKGWWGLWGDLPKMQEIWNLIYNNIMTIAMKDCNFEIISMNIKHYCDTSGECHFVGAWWRCAIHSFNIWGDLVNFVSIPWFEGAESAIIENFYLRGKIIGKIANIALGIDNWNDFVTNTTTE
jgi:hypothetical protein